MNHVSKLLNDQTLKNVINLDWSANVNEVAKLNHREIEPPPPPTPIMLTIEFRVVYKIWACRPILDSKITNMLWSFQFSLWICGVFHEIRPTYLYMHDIMKQVSQRNTYITWRYVSISHMSLQILRWMATWTKFGIGNHLTPILCFTTKEKWVQSLKWPFTTCSYYLQLFELVNKENWPLGRNEPDEF